MRKIAVGQFRNPGGAQLEHQRKVLKNEIGGRTGSRGKSWLKAYTRGGPRGPAGYWALSAKSQQQNKGVPLPESIKRYTGKGLRNKKGGDFQCGR